MIELRDIKRIGPPNGTGLPQFMSHVSKVGFCWLWTGLLTSAGYGRYGKGGKTAHRISWLFFHGSIPQGLWVLHKIECLSRNCVNPSHLYLGTPKDNSKDMVALGHQNNVKGSSKRN